VERRHRACRRLREFEVIMDRATGKLLSIYSRDDDVGKDLSCEEPEAFDSEEHWRTAISMQLPDTLPVAKFAEALNQMVFNPARVRIMRAMYVDVKGEEDSTEHWWVIIARCSEAPIVASSGGNSYVHSIMIGIDGLTGQWVFFTNAPGDLMKE